MNIKEYTKEFYRLRIHSSLDELEYLRVARYVNGLKFMIQDELSTHYFHSIEEPFHIALKLEEKLDRRKQNFKGRGRVNF
jgi:hypothetical protein